MQDAQYLFARCPNRREIVHLVPISGHICALRVEAHRFSRVAKLFMDSYLRLLLHMTVVVMMMVVVMMVAYNHHYLRLRRDRRREAESEHKSKQ